MREIITLQLGQLSNYTGAHFWNLQDEALGLGQEACSGVQEDALFAWSEDAHGNPLYYPRAVILDVSGATGGVSFSRDVPAGAAGGGGGGGAAAATWGGGVEVHAAGGVGKSAFTQQLELQAQFDYEAEPASALARHQEALKAAARQLDAAGSSGAAAGAAGSGGAAAGGGGGGAAGGVRYWTDYLKAQLHPRSFQAVAGVWAGGPPFEGYGAAEGLLGGARGAVEAAADAARWWAEQCDSLQGIQVLADDLSGFGGLSRGVLDELREELPGARVLYFSLRRPAEDSGTAALRDTLSDALATAELSERASLYLPLCPPSPAAAARALPLLRAAGGGSLYHDSALLAAAIDTATLPLRLAGGGAASAGPHGATDLHSWVQLLAGRGGATLAAAAMQLPAGAADPDSWRLAAAADERAGGASGGGMPNGASSGSSGGGGGSGYGLSTLRDAAVLTPGAPPLALQPGESLAESIVLRGARRAAAAAAAVGGGSGGGQGRACDEGEAAEALDGVLAAEPRRRCVVHRCVSSAALPIPLPWPGMFGPGLGPRGDVVLPWSQSAAAAAAAAAAGVARLAAADAAAAAAGSSAAPAAARDGRHVISCPVLTRVAATREFEPWLAGRAAKLGRAAAAPAGRALADAWGYGRGDIEEAGERLRAMAGSYVDSDDAEFD